MLDVVAVKDKCLEENVTVSIFYFIDGISCVINPFEVSGRLKIECFSNLVPGCLQLNEVFQVRQVLKVDELIV